jgi:hypothetical protein
MDYNFDYRSLDNEQKYKDGMTRQEYYLHYWGCEKPGIKEVTKKSTMDHSSTLKTTEKLFIFNET